MWSNHEDTSGRWRSPVTAVLVLVVGVSVLLVGCGVRTQDTAAPLPGAVVVRPEPSPDDSPVTGVDLYFVVDDQLVSVPTAASVVGVQSLLDQLAGGPPREGGVGMRSLVADPAGGTLVLAAGPDAGASPPAGVVTVAVTDAFASLPANEQVLLLGQVVLSLTAAGAEAVLFTDPQGAPLAVPLPDGRLLDRPATAADYHSLVDG